MCNLVFCFRHDHLYRYAATSTGLGSEIVEFSDSSSQDFGVREGQYILRPEVVESLYILNQLTGDPIYREMGWEIFQSIERYCKTKIAYGHYSDVQVLDLEPDDAMESFYDWRWVVRRTQHCTVEDRATSLTMGYMVQCNVVT